MRVEINSALPLFIDGFIKFTLGLNGNVDFFFIFYFPDDVENFPTQRLTKSLMIYSTSWLCEKLINHPSPISFLTVPSKPQNVRVLNITSTTIKIAWSEPERPNGVIHAYRVYYMFLNQTLLHLPMLKNDASYGVPFNYTLINLSEFTLSSPRPDPLYALGNEVLFSKVYSKHVRTRINDYVFVLLFAYLLKGPNTEYRIIVIAFTLKYDGEPSDPVIQRTDISGPSAPQIINLTCHSQDSLYLQWKRPTSFYNSIDFYMINYRDSGYNSYQQIQLISNASLADAWVSSKLSFSWASLISINTGKLGRKCISNESFFHGKKVLFKDLWKQFSSFKKNRNFSV